MCGICGQLRFDGTRPEEDLLRRMAASLSHRGPDDEGLFFRGPVGLGHRRLSIIDLSSSGHQPMGNEDGTVWIIFNGEIYNFRELHGELAGKGHVFRSRSDTEVILHLYEEEGPQCVTRLRGMFAFAIWDQRRDTLMLARDRVGKKPLYYFRDNRQLLFASEIKAILQDPSVQRTPDPIALHHYLSYQSVPSPLSAFQGISKVPPAHFLLCSGCEIKVIRYWDLSYLPKLSVTTAAADAALEEDLRVRLREAVRTRLISEVPLGAFLSGGLDSSAVVALMSEVTAEPVRTFSIGFSEEGYDELHYARQVAGRFNTEHTEFQVKPDAVDILPRLVRIYDEPFADPSAIPTYYVSQLARDKVTVILNGDGGDENFAGYHRYVANHLAGYVDVVPQALRKILFGALAAVLPGTTNPKGLLWQLKRFSQTAGFSSEMRNALWSTHFDAAMKRSLYTDAFAARTQASDSLGIIIDRYRQAPADTVVDRMLYADVTLYLADTLLTKVDRASMAHALEARSPFLDHEFMEFAARIPAHCKVRRGTTKWVLKRACRGMLPDDIVHRKKMGFEVPLARWFRADLKDMVSDLLLGKRCLERGYFRREAVQRMLDEHLSGAWNWQHHLYDLLMFELWHQAYIDNAPEGPRRP